MTKEDSISTGFQLSERIRALDDTVIDRIIALGQWPDNNTLDGKRANLESLNKIIRELEESMRWYKNDNSRDAIKTKRALVTYKSIRDEFNCDFAGYFSFALKSRRDDIVRLFLRK